MYRVGKNQCQMGISVSPHRFSIIKGVTAKMWLSLSISVHPWVLESPQLILFESFSSLNALTLGLGDSSTQGWTEIERLSHILVVTPCILSPAGWAVSSIRDEAHCDFAPPKLLIKRTSLSTVNVRSWQKTGLWRPSRRTRPGTSALPTAWVRHALRAAFQLWGAQTKRKYPYFRQCYCNKVQLVHVQRQQHRVLLQISHLILSDLKIA